MDAFTSTTQSSPWRAITLIYQKSKPYSILKNSFDVDPSKEKPCAVFPMQHTCADKTYAHNKNKAYLKLPAQPVGPTACSQPRAHSLPFLFRVKRPTGDEVFLQHMVQSHYAFGLVIFTRCVLVLKGYINIRTLKAAFKNRASIGGLIDLLEEKKPQPLLLPWTHEPFPAWMLRFG